MCRPMGFQYDDNVRRGTAQWATGPSYWNPIRRGQWRVSLHDRPAGPAKKKPRSHDRGFVLRIVITAVYRRAGDRTRTGDVQLGKLAFYQLNYARKPIVESHRSGLNRRPLDYESSALPLSYGGERVPWRGLEPRRLSAPPPQDGVSTNFTTRALNHRDHGVAGSRDHRELRVRP